MRVLSFIIAFVAALGFVAALPAPDAGSLTPSTSSINCFQDATNKLGPVRDGLSTISVAGGKPDASQVNVLIGEAHDIIVSLNAELTAGISLDVTLDVVVNAVVELLAVVVAIVEFVLVIAGRLLVDVKGIVATVKLLLQVILVLVARINVLFTANVIVAAVLVFIKAAVDVVVKLIISLGIEISL